jgi:hypothetical protein
MVLSSKMIRTVSPLPVPEKHERHGQAERDVGGPEPKSVLVSYLVLLPPPRETELSSGGAR